MYEMLVLKIDYAILKIDCPAKLCIMYVILLTYLIHRRFYCLIIIKFPSTQLKYFKRKWTLFWLILNRFCTLLQAL